MADHYANQARVMEEAKQQIERIRKEFNERRIEQLQQMSNSMEQSMAQFQQIKEHVDDVHRNLKELKAKWDQPNPPNDLCQSHLPAHQELGQEQQPRTLGQIHGS